MKIIKKVTLLNVVTAIVAQIFAMISGFILPRLILSYFGSEVNGLISSISQFLSYITILEGGVSGVIIASMYKPLQDKDENKISSIVKTADNFYRKIGLFFILYTLILSVVYPLVFKTTFSFLYVFLLIIILSINLLTQFLFALTMKNLLEADKKLYIVSISQILITVLNVILSIVSLKIYPNIHILKLISVVLYAMQPLLLNIFIKKRYKINKTVVEDKTLVKQRWDGFMVNLAAFVHFSTDVTILTIFTDFKTVSIYSVYAMIVNSIQGLIVSASTGLNSMLGHSYVSGDNDATNKKMDLYEFIIFLSVFFLFSVTGLLLTPFVMIYTKNIIDANYYQPIFGILLILSSVIYLIKFPHLNLAYSANKFKEIKIPAFCEAAINIVLSLILVPCMGLIGVAIGTIVAMLYRMIFHVYFTTKLIKRSQCIFYVRLMLFILFTIAGMMFCYFVIPNVQYNIVNWIWHGFVYATIMGLILVILSLFIFRKEIVTMKNYLKRKS